MFQVNSVLDSYGRVDGVKITQQLDLLTAEEYKEAALELCTNHYNVIQYFSYERLGSSYNEIAHKAILKSSAAIQYIDKRYIENHSYQYGKLARMAVMNNRALLDSIDQILITKHKELFAEIILDSKARTCDFPFYLKDEDEIKKIPSKSYKYVMLEYFRVYPMLINPAFEKSLSDEEKKYVTNAKNNTVFFNISSRKNSQSSTADFQQKTTSSLTSDQFNAIKNLITKLEKEVHSCWPYPNKDRKCLKIACLGQLINRTNQGEDATYVINKLIEKYPAIVKGEHSTRTNDLLEELKGPVSHTAKL